MLIGFSGNHCSLSGDNAVIDTTKYGQVQARVRKARVGPNAEVSEGDENTLDGEPVPVLRLQREKRELSSVQAQPRLVRQVHEEELHEPVRRSDGRGALGDECFGVR